MNIPVTDRTARITPLEITYVTAKWRPVVELLRQLELPSIHCDGKSFYPTSDGAFHVFMTNRWRGRHFMPWMNLDEAVRYYVETTYFTAAYNVKFSEAPPDNGEFYQATQIMRLEARDYLDKFREQFMIRYGCEASAVPSPEIKAQILRRAAEAAREATFRGRAQRRVAKAFGALNNWRPVAAVRASIIWGFG